MKLPAAVYHKVCRRWHELFHARKLIAVSIGTCIGWVRCSGVVLFVYETGMRTNVSSYV